MFGPALRLAREARGETLEQAARGMGIYASTLFRLETGARGAGDAISRAIPEYYGISIDLLRKPSGQPKT